MLATATCATNAGSGATVKFAMLTPSFRLSALENTVVNVPVSPNATTRRGAAETARTLLLPPATVRSIAAPVVPTVPPADVVIEVSPEVIGWGTKPDTVEAAGVVLSERPYGASNALLLVKSVPAS